MADSKKISELTPTTEAPHADDRLVIVDDSDKSHGSVGTTKSITFGVLKGAIEGSGHQGHQGHKGDEGTGNQGHQGHKGDEGTGNQGHQGHQGTAGTAGNDSTVRGHQGHQGHQGNKGDAGDTPTSVWSGDTLRFDVGGVQGPTSPSLKGHQGDQGVKGTDGTSVEIKGTFNSFEAIQASYGQYYNRADWSAGAMLIHSSTGDGYVWDGTPGGWSSIGQIKGPQGEQGEQGDIGPVPTHVWSGDKIKFATSYGAISGEPQYGSLSPSLSGQQGNQGHQGHQGVKGDTGSNATIGYNVVFTNGSKQGEVGVDSNGFTRLAAPLGGGLMSGWTSVSDQGDEVVRWGGNSDQAQLVPGDGTSKVDLGTTSNPFEKLYTNHIQCEKDIYVKGVFKTKHPYTDDLITTLYAHGTGGIVFASQRRFIEICTTDARVGTANAGDTGITDNRIIPIYHEHGSFYGGRNDWSYMFGKKRWGWSPQRSGDGWWAYQIEGIPEGGLKVTDQNVLTMKPLFPVILDAYYYIRLDVEKLSGTGDFFIGVRGYDSNGDALPHDPPGIAGYHAIYGMTPAAVNSNGVRMLKFGGEEETEEDPSGYSFKYPKGAMYFRVYMSFNSYPDDETYGTNVTKINSFAIENSWFANTPSSVIDSASIDEEDDLADIESMSVPTTEPSTDDIVMEDNTE